MFSILSGECQTSEANRIIIAIAFSEIEVGAYNDEFYNLISTIKKNRHDYVWVIIDRLMKLARFLLVKTTYTIDNYTSMYVLEIIRLNGALVSIVSNRYSTFSSKFWHIECHEHQFELQYNISSTKRRKIRKHDSNIRRHVMIFCI